MSQKIDPREVLVHLNELGYTNITAQQLKEFIIDLKKLLKYDLRFGVFAEGTNHKRPNYPEESEGLPEGGTSQEQSYCPEENEYGADENGTADGSDRENQINNDEAQKDVPIDKLQQKHIAVHIYDTKSKKALHDHCVHINNLNTVKRDIDAKKLELLPNKVSNGVSENKIETESTLRSIRPNSTRECSRECQSRASSKERKSKVAFIRPVMSRPSFNKSDPVALYHYYQSEWKRTKIPGQDHRDELRWAIRERMLSGPRVEVKSRCNIQRCGWR